jgi:hypothetical protein
VPDLPPINLRVNTGPLKDFTDASKQAKQGLGDLNTEMAKTKPAADQAASGVDKVGQSAKQTAANLDQASKSAETFTARTSSLARGLEALPAGSAKAVTAAEQLAASLIRQTDAAGKAIPISTQLDQIVTKTGVSYAQASAALQGAIAAHNAASSATASHAKEAQTLGTAAGAAVPSVVNLGDAVRNSLVPANLVSSVMGSASTGLAGFAAAAGAAAVEIVKAGDDVERSRSRFIAHTGSVQAGSAALEKVKGISLETGIAMDTIASAVERASQGVGKLNTGWPVIELNGNRAGAAIDKVSGILETLGKNLQTTNGTAAEAAAVFGTLADGFQSSGGLTAATFQKIIDISPQTARAIASAFGSKDIDTFLNYLKAAPQTIDAVAASVNQIKPSVDAAFDPSKPKTLEQALERLRIEGRNLGDTFAKTGAFDGLTKSLGATAKEVDQIAKGFPDFRQTFAQNVERPWSDMVSIVDNQNSIWGKSIAVNVDGAVEKALVEIGKLPTEGVASLTGFVNASIAQFQSWANAAIQSANTVGSALSNAASGIVAGGGTGNYDPMGSSTGVGTGNIGSQAGGYDYASAVAAGTYPAFAQGGSFTVGGSGGTDSQLIQFWATPGEKVDITPPGGDSAAAPQTLGSLIPNGGGAAMAAGDVMSAKLSDELEQQTAALSDKLTSLGSTITGSVNAAATSIAAAVKQATAGSLTSPSAAATPTTASNPASTSSVTSSTGGGGGGGGGSRGTGSSDPRYWSKEEEQKAKAAEAQQQQEAQQATSAAGSFANALGSGVFRGSGLGTIRGFQTGPGPLIGGPPRDPITGEPMQSQPITQPQQSPGTVRTFGGRDGFTEKVVPKEADLQKQTDALKQSQDTGSKSIADQVNKDSNQAKSIGDKTTSSLSDLSKYSSDQLRRLDTVNTSTKDSADATKADTVATKSGFDDTTAGLGDVKGVGEQTNSSIGDTTNAVSSGSSSIVDSVQAAASSIANAVSSAVSGAPGSSSGSAGKSSSSSSSSGSTGASGFGSDISSGDVSGSSGSSSSSSSSSVSDGGTPYTGPDIYSGVGTGDYSSMSSGSSADGPGSSDTQYAAGGQWTVPGPGHTDTQKVEFWASPGEVVTVTPPGGTPPANPASGFTPQSKGGAPAFALGGQLTLGAEMGSPGVSQASADLITSHVSNALSDQSKSIASKVTDVGTSIIGAISDSTKSIQSAISSVSSAIPDPVAPVAASSSGSSSGSGSGGTAEPTLHQKVMAGNYPGGVNNWRGIPFLADGYKGIQDWNDPSNPAASYYANLIGQASLAGVNFSDFSVQKFATGQKQYAAGGQFVVSPQMMSTAKFGGVAPRFASGGQMAVSGDSTGSVSAIGTDILASSFDSKTNQITAGITQGMDTLASRVVSAVNQSNNTIVAGVNGIKSRFDAWHNSVNTSAKTATVTSPSSSPSPGSAAPAGPDPAAVAAALAQRNAAMATSGLADGGVLTVPGGGSGTDSVDVAVKAAPGEKIFVMQPEDAARLKQSSKLQHVTPEPLKNYFGDSGPIPGGGSASLGSLMDGSAVGGAVGAGSGGMGSGSFKKIDIHVYPGVTADTFIKSRGEITRNM